jgi:large conductance mechanosensitive channel
MLKEFKEFAMRGNVLDMAVGFIIGAAFTSIVNSLVNDIIMPIIGLLLGDVDFKSILDPERYLRPMHTGKRPGSRAVTVNYGIL